MIETKQVGSFEGAPVHAHRLTNRRGMHAVLLDWGAVLMSLHAPVDEGSRALVLGYESFDDYPPRSPYFGATAGRFANRIGHATFELDGERFHLDANENGHHLHGGRNGLGRRLWRAKADEAANAVTFRIVSADGEMGYPGRLEAACRYRLDDDDVLEIEMTATTDRPTPVNLVHHSYWNLDGGGTIDAHALQVEADFYLPTGDGQIPTGEVLSVAGTALDLRRSRRLDAQGEPVLDNALVLREPAGRLRRAAQLVASDGRCRMELWTDQPAVQVYTGWKLHHEGSHGERFPARSGVCLETEAFPDAPNHAHFPSCILRPGEVYRHVMQHRFGFS
ncbi:MAG: galactose mutarotase [Geminicoccaceae bacterium]|nr:galactose mutarotase [Geminicoccaceae bacterium]